MIKQVFIINGSGGVGKDTFIDMIPTYELLSKGENLSAYIKNLDIGNYSSVSKVKEIAKAIGWDGGKTEKDRKFLSDLKVLCTEYNNMPFNSMKEKVSEFINSDFNALFIDIREPNEIEIAKQAFNAETVLVKRDSVMHITSNMADANVYNYQYDYIIENNGDISDLNNTAKMFVDKLFN